VVQQFRSIARNPIIIDAVLRELPEGTDRAQVARALASFDKVWDQVTPRDQERFTKRILRAVTYDGQTGRVTVSFASGRLKELIELGAAVPDAAEAERG
jgi:site-specific DNA recombinase